MTQKPWTHEDSGQKSREQATQAQGQQQSWLVSVAFPRLAVVPCPLVHTSWAPVAHSQKGTNRCTRQQRGREGNRSKLNSRAQPHTVSKEGALLATETLLPCLPHCAQRGRPPAGGSASACAWLQEGPPTRWE